MTNQLANERLYYVVKQPQKIYLIRGWHKLNLNVPDDIPDDWQIWNAARPFPAHRTWQGDFVRGIFYGAIDPQGDFGQEYIKRAQELDASLIEWKDEDDVMEYAKMICAKYRRDVSEFTFKQLAESYAGWLRRNGDK